MKIAITTFLIACSSPAFSQNNYVEIEQEFLSDKSKFGAWEIETHKDRLDKNLSESLKSNVLQSSGPYAITNMNEIETLIRNQKSKLYPDLKLSLNTFKGNSPLDVSIDSIKTVRDRNILRGKVDGFTGSEVKLVVYRGQMTGRVTFSDSKNVLVIRSIDGGISANYEIDTSDITYD